MIHSTDLPSPAALVMQQAAPRRSAFFRIFSHPRLRPPVLEEMMPDLDHLITKMVRPYVSQANVLLHEEDLRSLCYSKLGDLIRKGTVDKCPTRAKFFGMAKTSFKNVVCSMVQREAFTEKRTGVKAPPRHEQGQALLLEDVPARSSKVSLDDPDVALQVGDTACEVPFTSEVLDDLKVFLTPIERLVVDQVVSPNTEACQLAWLDSQRGGSSAKVNVSYAHQAAGLGLDTKIYRKILDGIKPKLLKFMSDEKNGESQEQVRVRLAESTLRAIFGLQIPPSTDTKVKRRIFTMAARSQKEKVKEDVAGLLEVVGAVTPVFLGDRLSCYGVLWEPNDRVCGSCLMQEHCRAVACNAGLGDIVWTRDQLRQDFVKVPVVGPRSMVTVGDVITHNDVEAEILSYLDHEFIRSVRADGLWFGSRFDGQSAYLVRACKTDNQFHLLFHSPSDSLRAKLTRDGKAWFLPEGITLEEAKDLIDQHANETLGVTKTSHA